MEWKMVWNGRRILVWNMEDTQNGMENLKDGMEDRLPYLRNSELRLVYRYAATRHATKIFRTLFYFTVHRSRENLRNPFTFTYIIILVACRVSVNAPLHILKLITRAIFL